MANRGLRTIRLRFTGDTKGLNEATRDGQQQLGKWQRGFQKLNKVATGALIGVGGAVAGAVTKTATAGDRIAKTAPQLGVTTDAYQEMAFWAERNGLAQEDMDRAVGRLNQRIGRALDGNQKYAEGFAALNVQLRDGQGNIRDTSTVLGETVQKLSAIQDPAEQSAKASEIFGTRMARTLAPALQDGALSLEEASAKAHELGLVMDQEALKNSEKFADAMTNLKGVGTGFLTGFAIPFLNVFVDDIVPAFEDKVLPALERFGGFLSDNQGAVLAVTGAVTGLAVAVKVVNAGIAAFNAIMRAKIVVTKAATVAQRALNLVLRANPIGIIITLIAGLVAGLVLAYRRSETFRKIVDAAFAAVRKAAQAVVRWFTGTFVPFFTTTIPNTFRKLVNFIVSSWRTIRDGAVTAFNAMMRFIRNIPGRIRDAFSNAVEFLVKAGGDIITGLLNGVRNAMDGIRNWLKNNVWDPIVNAVKGLFGISSPSTVFMDFGRQMILGLIRGMIRTDPAKLVRQALGGLGGAVTGVLGSLFGGGGGGRSANMELGQAMAAAMGWTGGQWRALRALWHGESGWNHLAENPSSGAYGIPQSLPASKMASAGSDWRTNPATQIQWGLGYIKSRYGSPASAYRAWLSRSPHWYDLGGIATDRGLIPKATSDPERVLSPRQTQAFERLVDILDRGAAGQPLVGEVNLNHVPGFTTPQDLVRGLRHAELAARYHRRR